MRADEVDPEIAAVLDRLADEPNFHELSVEEVRRATAEGFASLEGPDVGDVTDRTIPGPGGELAVRVYSPEGEGPFPVAVYFHGGGFVTGSLDSHDALCRALTTHSDVAFIAVDYRLAPEHPYPAAVEDACAATEWVAANGDEIGVDPDRLAVVGDSAGGNLAAAVSLVARDRDGPAIDYQALVYPAVSHGEEWPSYEENAEGYLLTLADVRWFADRYLESDVFARNPYASPSRACDYGGLPDATVVTAGFDPLRDQGVAYADSLEDAGVAVCRHHYPDAVHAFLQMAGEPLGVERAREAIEAVAGDLREALA